MGSCKHSYPETHWRAPDIGDGTSPLIFKVFNWSSDKNKEPAFLGEATLNRSEFELAGRVEGELSLGTSKGALTVQLQSTRVNPT